VAEDGEDDEGVELVAGVVVGAMVAAPPAAVATAREELGGMLGVWSVWGPVGWE